jgi:hypothetical protein
LRPHTTRRLLFVLLVAGMAAGCKRGPDRWVIFSGAPSSDMRRQCSRDFPPDLVEGWTPSPGDVKRAETAVDKAVAEALAKLPAARRPQGQVLYYRQYAGFMRNGRRVLYVNGLGKTVVDQATAQRPQDMPWRTEVVMTCDGGAQYFGAVVDAESGAVDHVEFNGPHDSAAVPDGGG